MSSLPLLCHASVKNINSCRQTTWIYYMSRKKQLAVVRASRLIELMLPSVNWLVSDGCHNVSAGLLARSHKWWQMIVAYMRAGKHNDSSSHYSIAAGFLVLVLDGRVHRRGRPPFLQLKLLISCVLRFSSMFSLPFMFSNILIFILIYTSPALPLLTSYFSPPHSPSPDLFSCSLVFFFPPPVNMRSSVVYHLLPVFIFPQTSSHLSCFHTIPSVNRLARLFSAAASPPLSSFPKTVILSLRRLFSPASPPTSFCLSSARRPHRLLLPLQPLIPLCLSSPFPFCPTRHSATWRQKTETRRWWRVRVHLHINLLHSSPLTRDNWKEVFPKMGQPPVFKCWCSKQSERAEIRRVLSGLQVRWAVQFKA